MIPRAGHACCPACEERQQAMDDMVFLWSSRWNGWIDLSIPTRSTSITSTLWFTKHRARQYRQEPYTFTCCPWCGGDLPDHNDHHPRSYGEGSE